MARRKLRAQVACYLSFNLITFANLLLALRFTLLVFLPPARRYQVRVAWLMAGIAAVVLAELWRDLLKNYAVNVC